MRIATFTALGAACVTLGACNQGPSAEDMAALNKLQDRIAIEDLIVGYYGHLGTEGAEGIANYYTPDAVFDLNGQILTGHEEIMSAYAPVEGAEPAFEGTFHMLLSNPVIEVNGDTATARFIWTGIVNTDTETPPHLQEQGREYDLLEKQEDGSWLIAKRTIIADSNIPARFATEYTPRLDYDITAE